MRRRPLLWSIGGLCTIWTGCSGGSSRQAGSLRIENRDDRQHRVHVSVADGPETTVTVGPGETVTRESFVAVYDTQYSVAEVSGTATVTLDETQTATIQLDFHFHTEGQGPGGPLGGDYLTVVISSDGRMTLQTPDDHLEHGG